ncbi:MAG: hypothetical protein ACYS4W_09655 [Planctomycetota bacterium]
MQENREIVGPTDPENHRREHPYGTPEPQDDLSAATPPVSGGMPRA